MFQPLRLELCAEFAGSFIACVVPIHAHDHRRHILARFKRVDQLSDSRAACRNGGAPLLHDRQCTKCALDNEHRRILIQRLFVEQRLRPGVLGAWLEEPLVHNASGCVVIRFHAVRYDDRIFLRIKSKPEYEHALTGESSMLQIHLCSRCDGERLDTLIDVP